MTSFAAALAVEPVAKGRPRFGHGRVYTPHETAEFENTVRWLLRQKQPPLLKGDVAVDVTFWIRKQNADGDNYAKAFLDASQGLLFANDRQVRDCHYRLVKVAAGMSPHIEFTAREMDLRGAVLLPPAFLAHVPPVPVPVGVHITDVDPLEADAAHHHVVGAHHPPVRLPAAQPHRRLTRHPRPPCSRQCGTAPGGR